jgi:hypothetical protein
MNFSYTAKEFMINEEVILDIKELSWGVDKIRYETSSGIFEDLLYNVIINYDDNGIYIELFGHNKYKINLEKDENTKNTPIS